MGRVAMVRRREERERAGWRRPAGWGWREANDDYGGEQEERKLFRIV
jgi:hypothetical protein